MREIKFRLYYENKMYYSDNKHMEFDQPKREWIPFLFWIGSSSYESNKFSALMQFTGLQDKNGKDIYEGDICKINYLGDSGTYEGIVKFRFPLYYLDMGTDVEEEITVCQNGWIEVIGNIYENPELLESK